MASYFDTGAAIGAVKNVLLTATAILLFAFFGPPVLPISRRPDVQIKDVADSLIMPPSRPLEGPLAPNSLLEGATVLFNNTIQSSESVYINDDGSILLLDRYGEVFKAVADADEPGGYRLEAYPGLQLGPGRPLGFKKYTDGSIIVCNAGLGLIRAELPDAAPGAAPRVTLLSSYVSKDSPIDPQTQILYPNALAITRDGDVIYFTDSQTIPVLPNWGQLPRRVRPYYDTFYAYLLGVFSGQATGRILAYYPNNGSTHVIAKGFWFPNGMSLSESEDSLIFAETNTMRLLRLWVKGSKAGKVDVFVDRLPGPPDGVSRAPGGKGFWVALPAPRTAMLDAVIKFRGLRVVASWLPPRFVPKPKPWGAVALVSPEGEIVRWLLDITAKTVGVISDVEEQVLSSGQSRLWMGSVTNNYIAYVDL